MATTLKNHRFRFLEHGCPRRRSVKRIFFNLNELGCAEEKISGWPSKFKAGPGPFSAPGSETTLRGGVVCLQTRGFPPVSSGNDKKDVASCML